jgi:hypothetical protein
MVARGTLSTWALPDGADGKLLDIASPDAGSSSDDGNCFITDTKYRRQALLGQRRAEKGTGMSESRSARETGASSGREELVLPGDAPEIAKLPFPTIPAGHAALPAELREAWTQYMIGGFKQNEEMFRSTLQAFMKPYWLTICLYAIMFVVGIGLFLTAVILGLTKGDSVVTIAFAGLSVTTFLAFFIRHPLRALEENLEFITWLGVAFNTYWTRLMYVLDASTVQQELAAADQDFTSSVEKLIERHAKLRNTRPGGGK